MLTTVSLLSLAWVATPITISEVAASREAGRLVIDISADAMVDPEVATAKVDDGRIFLYVGETRVKADNRAWGEGTAQIRAHRHRHQIELVVPLEDAACQGPVEFVKAPTGLRATIACDGAGAAGRSSFGGARVRAKAPVMAEAKEQAKLAVALPAPEPEAETVGNTKELRAVLGPPRGPALDEETAIEAAPIAAPVKPGPPALVAVPVMDKPAPAPVAVAPVPGVAAVPGLAVAAAPKTEEVAPRAAAPTGGGGGIYLAALLLAALGGAAYFFARRRAITPRYVKIIETASLGPKRSIVVAEIGGERIILGTSEAGITVLTPRSEPPAPSPAPVAGTISVPSASPVAASSLFAEAEAPVESDVYPPLASVSLIDELADIPEPDVDEHGSIMPVQGGLLARLFKRGKPANESEFHNFEEMLDDSVEDQELRHKLSLGMAGRVK